jgi:phytoene synthase
MNTQRAPITQNMDTPEAQSALAMSYERLTKGSRSFRLASYFLPVDVRDDAARVYSFCRLVDDLGDDAPDVETATKDLQGVRESLAGTQTPDAIVAEYASVAQRTGISPRTAEELIAGVLSDQTLVRIPDDAALLLYAYRVASTVGLMMCGVLGVRDPRALPHAIDLGLAMQLTNICRDVLEDSRMGRVYLPADRLSEAGTSAQALAAQEAEEKPVATVVAELLTLADQYYESAESGIRFIPWRARMAIVVAARVYRSIGRKLARNHYNALTGRTVVHPARRVLVALWACIAFFKPRIQGWTRYGGHQAHLHALLPWDLPGVDASNERGPA